MTSDPEELVRLQGYGEMTLRTAVTTVMALAPRDRAITALVRVRDGVRLASGEIAELASEWGVEHTGAYSPSRRAANRDWPTIVRGMVRDAPLPALLIAFLAGVVVTRR